MLLIVTSDWHLDAHTGGVERFDDILELLNRAAAAAIEARGAFAFLGDLCDPDDGPTALRCIVAAQQVARGLSAARIPNLWLAGNHDVCASGRGLTTLSPIAMVSGTVVVEDPVRLGVFAGLDVLALPYTEPARTYDPDVFVREYGHGARLVVGHLNLEGIQPGSETIDMPRGRDVFWPLDALREVCPDALLLAGHYHTRQVYRGVQIVGAIGGALTFGEEGNRPGFLEVTL